MDALIERAIQIMCMGTPGPWTDDGDSIGTRANIVGNIVCFGPSDNLAGSHALWPNNKRAIIGARELLPQLTAEVRRLQQLAEWRPIEEAPKDGTEIECWCPDIGVRVLFYTDEQSWCLAGSATDDYEPTHYRPLPTGPA